MSRRCIQLCGAMSRRCLGHALTLNAATCMCDQLIKDIIAHNSKNLELDQRLPPQLLCLLDEKLKEGVLICSVLPLLMEANYRQVKHRLLRQDVSTPTFFLAKSTV